MEVIGIHIGMGTIPVVIILIIIGMVIMHMVLAFPHPGIRTTDALVSLTEEAALQPQVGTTPVPRDTPAEQTAQHVVLRIALHA